jgi:ribosomal protein RSM22 (predicted rRNA methylase)
MLDAAQIMTKGRIADAAFLSKISEVTKLATEGSANVDAQASNGRYDLAVLSYTLSEMTSDPARRAAVQVMFELLDVNGYLVIIEPGNPYGSHTVRTGELLPC